MPRRWTSGPGLAELEDHFGPLMRDVRALPGGEGIWQRVEAYPGTRLDRDVGAGSDADGWLAEVGALPAPEMVARVGTAPSRPPSRRSA